MLVGWRDQEVCISCRRSKLVQLTSGKYMLALEVSTLHVSYVYNEQSSFACCYKCMHSFFFCIQISVCLYLSSGTLTLQEARIYAEENGLFFMETSAKTAANVNDVFHEIGTHTFLFGAFYKFQPVLSLLYFQILLNLVFLLLWYLRPLFCLKQPRDCLELSLLKIQPVWFLLTDPQKELVLHHAVHK